MGWLVGKTPAQVSRPSSRTWWCERTNQALAFGNAFVRSLVTGFLGLIPQPRCRRRQASARIVSGGGDFSRFVAFGKPPWSSGNVRGGRATDPPHSPVGSVRATEGSSSPRRPSLCSFARR